MRRFTLFLSTLLMLASLTLAQETQVVRPVRVGESKPLRELAQEYQSKKLTLQKTQAGDREIPNRPPVYRLPDDNRQDPLWQRTQGENVSAPITLIEGVSSDDNAAAFGFRVMPPDVNGDVGTGHIVETVNLLYRIWNKTGTPLIAPTPTDALWSGFGGNCELNNDGDPVVIYDHVNDRWIISQFVFSVSQCIACSKTGDPTGAYWLFEFSTPGNDYPKMSVMPSAYYGTIRNFSAGFAMDAHAWNDDKMRAGDPSTEMLVKTLTGVSGIDGVQPADLAGPPPAGNTSGHFVGHDDAGDRLYTYELTPNFPAGTSSLTGPSFIPVAAYSAAFAGGFFGTSIPQPGTTQKLDVLAPFTRFAPNFRDFGTHQTMIVNHVVDINDFVDHAGERWYELRKVGAGAWTVFQSGTFAPDANHRWMGNAAMNGLGDIAIGYSASSGTLSPSVRYTGRASTDPLGTMTLAESTIAAGGGSQLGGSRWGDYSRITVDPSDDKTFWYFGEYVQATGSFEWNTKIGSFQVSTTSTPSLSINDVAVTEGDAGTVNAVFTVTLSAASTQVVTVNYATANGTATAGLDYVAGSGTLSIPAGNTTQQLTVAVNGDLLDELNETFFINLSSPVNATFGDNQGQGTINDNDPQPSLSINDANVTEGNTGTVNANFTVTLSAASGQQVTVNYTTADGTATAGSDYVAASGTLTFSAGTTTQSLTVVVNGDMNTESNETFFVNLSSPVNAACGDCQGQGNIITDDVNADVVIWLPPNVTSPDFAQKARERGLTEEQVRNMAKAPLSHTALQAALTANSKTSTIISDITSVNLSSFEAVFALLGIFPNNHVVLNNSAEALALVNYIQGGGKVYLEGGDVWYYDPIFQGGHDFAPLFGLDGLADGGADLEAILGVNGTFTQGQRFKYSGQESFIDRLGVVGSGFVIHTNQLPVYNNGVANIDAGAGAKTIGTSFEFGGLIDNAGGPTKSSLMQKYLQHFGILPSLSINDVTVTEGDAGTVNATFTVALSSASSQSATVNYATANGTATAGSDYVAGSGTLTFPAGTLTQTVSVAVNGDLLSEAHETFFVNLSNNSSNVILADNQGAGTIIDDDAQMLIWQPADVSTPDITQKARQRGLTEAQVLAMIKTPESVLALQAALTANCKSSIVVTDITAINLSKFQAVFVVVGIFPNNHVIPANSAEALALVSYIQSGGEVYMEGGDVWYYDPPNAGGHNFASLFGLNGLVDGNGDLATVTGVNGTITQGMNFTYAGQNNFIDQLSTNGGFTIHTNSSPVYNCGIALNNTGTGAKTIGNSFAFDGLTDNTSTKTDLMRQYLTHFGIPQISISINDVAVTEGNSGTVNANFTVTLSAASSQAVTVAYATANGSATAGSDYVAGSGTVTFPPGSTVQTLTVAVNGDATFEPSENFFVNLSNPTCAILADVQGVGTILNDDALVFNPTDDAYVNSNAPTTNYGTAATLRMKQATQIFNSYLKFTVSGVTGTITSAKVRMKVVAASNSGGAIYTTSTSWSEATITYNNAPPITGTPLDTKGSVTLNQIVEFNVAAVVVGNGTYSFGLKNSSTTAVQYDSDEATRAGFMRPELTITLSTASATAKAADFTSLEAEAEVEKAVVLPERLTLSANYPNPFNPQTVIGYGLPEPARVRVAIYNIMGQVVRTLVDEVQPAGYRQVQWDGRNENAQNVGSGVYLYVLEAGRQRLVKKMILQR